MKAELPPPGRSYCWANGRLTCGRSSGMLSDVSFFIYIYIYMYMYMCLLSSHVALYTSDMNTGPPDEEHPDGPMEARYVVTS